MYRLLGAGSMSVRTVEKHRASLMFTLDVTTMAALMIYAMKEGLLGSHKQRRGKP